MKLGITTWVLRGQVWGCFGLGGSSHSRGRVFGERPATLQAQGAAGRYHQGGQTALLLPEARRKEACERSAGAQAQPQKSAQGAGLVEVWAAARDSGPSLFTDLARPPERAEEAGESQPASPFAVVVELGPNPRHSAAVPQVACALKAALPARTRDGCMGQEGSEGEGSSIDGIPGQNLEVH
jgi:hypothetical protein